MPRHVREQAAHRDASLTVVLKIPRAAQRVAAAVELRGLHLETERFAVFLLQAWLGIKGVDTRRAAVHVEENDALGLGGKMGLLGGQRAGTVGLRLTGQHRGQSHSAETIGTTRQHLPPRHRRLGKLTAMMHGENFNESRRGCNF